MDKVINYLLSMNLWVSVILIVAVFTAWLILKKFVTRQIEKHDIKGKQRHNIRLIMMSLKIILFFLVIVTILQIHGINVMSLVTGLGVAGIIVGFALQDLLKDMMMGTNILWDNFFKIGDMVRYKDMEGQITFFNIKVTKIYDVNTGETHIISNRNISEIIQLSDWLDVKIPAPYEIPAARMRQIGDTICHKITAVDKVTSCDFLGADEFADSKINYRIRLHCPADEKSPMRRIALGTIQDVFEEEHIAMPYPHMTVEMK